MNWPQLLVTAYSTCLEESALLLLDLDRATYEVLLPYPGPVCATDDDLYIARFLGARTRLEKYDRDGLAWMRRVPHCVDTHSVARIGDEIALCSTGTNEIIFLDENGTELRRWCPDPQAEPDSWHLNALTSHDGLLYATCFGRFDRFRGWCGRIENAGLLLEVESGRRVLTGLSAPHDPRRVENGWLLNESQRARMVLFGDNGSREEVASVTGFPRGLAVLPDWYVLGVSSPRTPEQAATTAQVRVIHRHTHELTRCINLPYPEIGHIVEAPSAEVIAAIKRQQTVAPPCLLPERAVIAEHDRAGSVSATGPLTIVSDDPLIGEVELCISNRGHAVWSSENRLPVHLSYQIVTAEGGVLLSEGARIALPLPVMPGNSLSFPVRIDLTICHHLPAAAAVRLTLLQETIAWWKASNTWAPAVVPLPPPLGNRAVPSSGGWWRGPVRKMKLRPPRPAPR